MTSTATPTATPSNTPAYDSADLVDNTSSGATSVSSYPYSVSARYIGFGADGYDYFAVPVVSGNSYSFSATISSGSGTITVENRGQSDSATLQTNSSGSVATINFTSAGITGTVYIRVSAGTGLGYSFSASDVTGATATATPTATRTRTMSETPMDSPSASPTATETPLIPSATETPSPTATDTPSAGCATCFCPPAAPPVTVQPLFEGTGSNQLGSGGGDAAQWTAPAPSAMSQDSAVPSPDGNNYLVWYIDWNNPCAGGWWGGGGYNWASWWNVSKEYDKDTFDTVEFYIRGELGTESALTIKFACATGGTNTIPLTGVYTASSTLSTSWEYVRVPLCDFDWTGADGTHTWEIDLSSGYADCGVVTFYVSDIKFAKY